VKHEERPLHKKKTTDTRFSHENFTKLPRKTFANKTETKKLVTIQIRKKREPGNLFIQRKEHLQIANSRDPRDKSLYFPLILCVFSQFFRNSFVRLECSSFQWQWRIIALIEGK